MGKQKIIVQIDKELHRKLVELAKEEDRSLSSVVRIFLADGLKKVVKPTEKP